MNRRTALLAGLVTLLLAAPAQASDGETPVNEGICDGLVFATPGLYGLCIAYCEAQDLDLVKLNDPDEIMKAMPKRSILNSYYSKKGPYDPDLPCLMPPGASCPCFGYAEAVEVVQGMTKAPLNQCHCYHRITVIQDPPHKHETWFVDWREILTDQHYQLQSIRIDVSEGEPSGSRGFCWYIERDTSIGMNEYRPYTGEIEELVGCVALIEEAVANESATSYCEGAW